MNISRNDLSIIENAPLAPYTTLGVGGPTRFLIKARTEEQIQDAIEFARARSCPVFILGGGSNLVISDSGYSGLVLKIELAGIQAVGNAGAGRLSVAAGVDWDALVQYCVSRNLAGIECLSGIPGTVGGAPVQNIGAYGEEISEIVSQVTVLDRATNRILVMTNADCGFAYRSSLFNTTHRDRYILLRVDFGMRTDGIPRIHYPDLQKRFASSKAMPDLREVREAVMLARRSKGMIRSDDDPDARSAGSFFKNPVLDIDAIARSEKAARSRNALGLSENIPRFPASPGRAKLSAAWLIEHAGFKKGFVYKNAGISSKHALALINRGGATARDLVELMRLIQARVQEVFGIELHPEPVFVGEFQ